MEAEPKARMVEVFRPMYQLFRKWQMMKENGLESDWTHEETQEFNSLTKQFNKLATHAVYVEGQIPRKTPTPQTDECVDQLSAVFTRMII